VAVDRPHLGPCRFRQSQEGRVVRVYPECAPLEVLVSAQPVTTRSPRLSHPCMLEAEQEVAGQLIDLGW